MFGGGSGCTGFGAFCICKGFRTIFGFRVYSRDLGFQGLRSRVLWERDFSDFRFIGQDGKTSLERAGPIDLPEQAGERVLLICGNREESGSRIQAKFCTS